MKKLMYERVYLNPLRNAQNISNEPETFCKKFEVAGVAHVVVERYARIL